MPATAQVTMGSGPLNFISGTIPDRFDQDMYLIRISGTTAFSATTVSSGTPTTFDTQLFLFNSSGLGLLANDNASTSEVRSTIPSTVLASGLYYLAVSKYNADPLSSGGLIFPDTPRTGVAGPTGPGGGLPISAWTSGDPGDPSYTIDLTGAAFATPAPSSLALGSFSALSCLVGAAVRRRLDVRLRRT